MPKGSPELTASRKEEIINACEKLYQTMSFKEITIRDIGAVTSFTRTSIYNYFQTKEEIFLSLMQREYELWAAEVNTLAEEHNTMSANDFAAAMAHSLEKHEQLLKLLAMNHYDMEENSRLENLVSFKKAYGASLDAVSEYFSKFCPDMKKDDINSFIYTFFPFMFGIYPYTVVTKKQEKAMKTAQIEFEKYSVYEIIYNCVKKLLGGKENE